MDNKTEFSDDDDMTLGDETHRSTARVKVCAHCNAKPVGGNLLNSCDSCHAECIRATQRGDFADAAHKAHTRGESISAHPFSGTWHGMGEGLVIYVSEYATIAVRQDAAGWSWQAVFKGGKRASGSAQAEFSDAIGEVCARTYRAVDTIITAEKEAAAQPKRRATR